MSILKDQIGNNVHQLNLVDTKINSQKKYLRDLSEITAYQKNEKLASIKSLQSDIRELNEANQKVSLDVAESKSVTTDMVTTQKELSSLNEFAAGFKAQQKDVVKQAKFFEDNDTCPTCDQQIDTKLKEWHLNKCKTKAGTIANALTLHKTRSETLEAKVEELGRELEQVRNWQSKVDANTQEISRINRNIDKLNDEISRIDNESGDMSEANSALEELRAEKETLQETKYKLNEQHSYNQVYAELLKDTGIKTKIIKQYLPVINQLTNKYLQILDFFVHFDLDESFVETIRSRHRDNFSYDSFSEGEKQRIDLSLLFTWRQIAKMKNSVATNLLVLDETFDSSLDEEGIENLMKIISTLGEDTNVFVISHKSELEDAHFHRKIEFVKEKNFSKIKA
jgi:DNA repair exonuclease SbcCD ATPase subunit